MKTKLFLSLALLALVSLPLLAAEIPTEGSAAPSFTLTSQAGAKVGLEQFKGKWVVLYFYPKDFTPGCTLEAHNFQRDLEQYTKKNAEIVGVSVDDGDSHKGFCDKEALHFTLLSDTAHEVSDKYGSVMEHDGKFYSARNTFLIDPKGVIRKVYVKVKPPAHSEEVLADLGRLQAAAE